MSDHDSPYQPNGYGELMRDYDSWPRAARDVMKEYVEYHPKYYLGGPVAARYEYAAERKKRQERKLNEVLQR